MRNNISSLKKLQLIMPVKNTESYALKPVDWFRDR